MVCAVSLVLILPAAAHHGWVGREEQVTSLTGTLVMRIRLAGPHGTMKIRVDGKVWDITLPPPARASRTGLTPTAIPSGATVTVRGNKNIDPGKREMRALSVTHGDRTFQAYAEHEHE
jgi:hypothetical protein